MTKNVYNGPLVIGSSYRNKYSSEVLNIKSIGKNQSGVMSAFCVYIESKTKKGLSLNIAVTVLESSIDRGYWILI